MIPKQRIAYLTITFGVMLLGLLSRKVAIVPLAVGDLLYAVFIYFGFRFLFYKHYNTTQTACLGLLFCYLIEYSQLLDFPLLQQLRQYAIVRTIIGQGFLWTDILAYTLGTLLANYADKKLN